MLITFITGDGEFTTNMFKSVNDAKDFLADDITDIMIQDLSEDHAIIVVPNTRVAIFNDEQHVTKAPNDFTKIISNISKPCIDSIEQEIMKNEDVSITPMTPEEADDLPNEPDVEVPPATDEDVQRMIKEYESFGHLKINDKKDDPENNPEKKSNKQDTNQNNNDDNKAVED